MSATGRAVLEGYSAGRLRAARLVWALHVVVVAFFLVGWALPWPEALAFTVGLSIATQIGWWSCERPLRVLTVLSSRQGRQRNRLRRPKLFWWTNPFALVISLPQRWQRYRRGFWLRDTSC